MKNIPHEQAPDGPVVPSVCISATAGLPTGDRTERDGMEQKRGMMPSPLRMLAENGIDTTELEAAIENGDLPAIHAFFQKIRPTGAGAGSHHGDVFPGPASPDSSSE
ncbi:hypothetical protein [Methanogenium organophilum]|uniref:Uncharacterized protein n=1 Tax=Methanogenium organophilum TaxID=2199 RepID=A0A9X9S5D3_METOG|nr:hypothetical protein [Methanogenium organophilum]WAI01770.1 hypothetical protein OU421_02535 [Methanogenium organophilum]